MPSKKQKPKTMHEWSVPARVTLDGHAHVEAETEEGAIDKVEQGRFDIDHTFSMVDWEVRGEPKNAD